MKSYVKYLQTGGAGGAGEIDNYKTDKAKEFCEKYKCGNKKIRDCYLKTSLKLHPDKGGTGDFAELNGKYEAITKVQR